MDDKQMVELMVAMQDRILDLATQMSLSERYPEDSKWTTKEWASCITRAVRVLMDVKEEMYNFDPDWKKNNS